jgi:hypothetical protein
MAVHRAVGDIFAVEDPLNNVVMCIDDERVEVELPVFFLPPGEGCREKKYSRD